MIKTIILLLITFFVLIFSPTNSQLDESNGLENTPFQFERVRTKNNKSDYYANQNLPTLERAPVQNSNPNSIRPLPLNKRSLGDPHDAESMRIVGTSVSKTQIQKTIDHDHNTSEFLDVKDSKFECKKEIFSKKDSDNSKVMISPDLKLRNGRSSLMGQNLISGKRPLENTELYNHEGYSRDVNALEEGLVIVRNFFNECLAFNSDGYISNSTIPDAINFQTYRNMGLILDYAFGSSYAYIFSVTGGRLGFETHVQDFMVGGNLTIVRGHNNRAFIYKSTGYAGWMNNIIDYTVGHNIAILRSSTQIFIYTYSGGLIATLPFSDGTIKAGDNVAVIMNNISRSAYIYNSAGVLLGTRENISDFSVGGNMLIVRTGLGVGYVYSDEGYQGYETQISDYQAGGNMAILRNTSGTTYTYKYNGYLYTDSSVLDYEAGGTLATVFKSSDVIYTYKFSGYYVVSNGRDFAVGGNMAVVRLNNTTGTNAYIYSDLEQVSSDISCIDYKVGGRMATTKVANGNIYTYSNSDYIGSTSMGTIMAPGGQMTVTKSSSGQVKVWDIQGQLDIFSDGIIDFTAGESMCVVRGDQNRNYKAYLYKPNAYITYEPNVKDFRVAGVYTNSGGTVGVVNSNSEIPTDFSLRQNYPNPFNPVTNFRFGIPKSGYVSLNVYDLSGKLAATLVNERKSSGSYEIKFDASGFSSGVYFYSLEVDGITVGTRKMILLK